MSENDWKVFQSDVLDVFRQYRGFFDFFERVGSLRDSSRPDCFARITREGKKEVWVIDAKNKSEVSEDDRNRMDKYVKMVESNPIDVGLELSELSEHEIRGIFVTSSESPGNLNYETVSFPELHPFLQKELIYTDMDRVVRDISKMMERRQLSQSHARLLFQGIKPFEERIEEGLSKLGELETEFVGLEVERPPISSYDYSIPVDAVCRHENNDQLFLFDIPYSEEALNEVEEKVEEIRERIKDRDRQVYYAAINTFESKDSEFIVDPGELRREISETANVLSIRSVLELFEPKIKTEETIGDGFIELESPEIDYRARVQTSDDTSFKVEVALPRRVVPDVKDYFLNTRKMAEISGDRLRFDFKVVEDLEIEIGERKEKLESFRDSVRGLYRSVINPALGKIIGDQLES